MPDSGDGAHRVWLGTLTTTMAASRGAVAVIDQPPAHPLVEHGSAQDRPAQLPGARAMASQLQPFGRLGQYRLLKRIGEGGTALVYRAVGPDDRVVAVKTLQLPAAGDPAARNRMAREVAAMQRLHSPFVAEVIDADITGIIPYFVTTLVEGPTLAGVVARHGPLRTAELQRAAYGLAEGLAAVHAAGLVHRDLKPGNVVMADGDPVLIDFGIAYHPDDAPLTQTGTFVGTPGYLAPEVISGQRAKAPADIFAWGTTVGFAARGEPVYGSGSCELVFSRILNGDANLDGIHGALNPLVAAALLREPRHRPTAAWLAREVAGLDLAAPQPPPASPPAIWVGTTAPGAPREITWLGLAAPQPPPASPPATWVGTTAPGPSRTGSRAPARQEIADQRPAEVVRLLPAVRDAPVPQTASAGRVVRVARPRKHPLLAVVAFAMAVSASFVLPVLGTVLVAVLLTLLGAGSRVRKGLAVRRYARGLRAWDSFLGAFSFPWALARSVVETALLAPILLGAAAVAVAADTIWFRGPHIHSAWAGVAAVYTALSCLGPWSQPARRELNRVLSAPLNVAVAMLSAGAMAMIIAALLLIGTAPTWPLPDPPSLHIHISGFNPVSFHG